MILATSDPEQIETMLDTMSKNRDIIESDINNLVYHMQGGLDYNDAWLLTTDQRTRMARMISKIINPKSDAQ